MAPLEPWEKVLVNVEEFAETEHGQLSCQECHNGTESDEKEAAHEGLIARPSEGEAAACSECHQDTVELQMTTSLHSTQAGYWTALEDRGADPHDAGMEEMFGNHCQSCHTSCGDCHVSQPASAGGGLLDGHLFTDSPPMTRTCTACHGSRVGNEYMGKNEGILADLHFRQERMVCIDCHSGSEMHGEQVNDPEAEPAMHRYEGTEGPSCAECHEAAYEADDDVKQHSIHGKETMSCQVCHSTTYTSCDSCHVQVSEESGNAYFTTEATYSTFMIGLNPLRSGKRPYVYTLLRHIPVDPESFAYYGDNLLPEFDNRPTWQYATPHNIQRITPQNSDCNACHGNGDIFLTADKVNPIELNANMGVIVEEIPEEMD